MNYVSAGIICKECQISYVTLKKWKDEGKINVKILSKKKILYDLDSINNQTSNVDNRFNVIYGRVSTQKQKNDLEHQINLIKEYMISNGIKPDKIYSDIGSGLNENRLQLKQLLNDITQNKIKKIFITYKDRLTRFGFDYFLEFCKLHNTEIFVIDNFENNKTNEEELVEDLISIIHHYSTKLYSNRKKKLKEIENLLK